MSRFEVRGSATQDGTQVVEATDFTADDHWVRFTDEHGDLIAVFKAAGVLSVQQKA